AAGDFRECLECVRTQRVPRKEGDLAAFREAGAFARVEVQYHGGWPLQVWGARQECMELEVACVGKPEEAREVVGDAVLHHGAARLAVHGRGGEPRRAVRWAFLLV